MLIAAPINPIIGSNNNSSVRLTIVPVATLKEAIPGRFVPSKNGTKTLQILRTKMPIANIRISTTAERKELEKRIITISFVKTTRNNNKSPHIIAVNLAH